MVLDVHDFSRPYCGCGFVAVCLALPIAAQRRATVVLHEHYTTEKYRGFDIKRRE